MEKKVKIGDKEFTIKEIPYIEAININSENRSETSRTLFKLSVGLSDEEINKLTLKEGIELQKVIIEVNGLGDFTVPTGNE